MFSLLFGSYACKAEEGFYQVTASDKAFFKQVQKAVLAEDWEWLSTSIAYPIEVQLKKGTVRLKTKEELKKSARLIFDEGLKKVVQDQSEATLFKNWQGVMIGQGEIWFSDVGKTDQKSGQLTKIIAINRIADKGTPHK